MKYVKINHEPRKTRIIRQEKQALLRILKDNDLYIYFLSDIKLLLQTSTVYKGYTAKQFVKSHHQTVLLRWFIYRSKKISDYNRDKIYNKICREHYEIFKPAL